MLPGVLYRLAELEDADIVLECGGIPGWVLGDAGNLHILTHSIWPANTGRLSACFIFFYCPTRPIDRVTLHFLHSFTEQIGRPSDRPVGRPHTGRDSNPVRAV